MLLRAGYIRQLGAGLYSHLFLAQRSFLKIQRIVREEMTAIGAQELLLPALHPAELWQEAGRYDVVGDNLFRLKDRTGRPLCLAMTHEEAMTDLARGELRSYKQLPQIWFQIQAKFRDEPRPKSGLLRVRQFLMKDSYSFDLTPEGLDHSYELHRQAYCRIFSRCGLEFLTVEAHSGSMGGSVSQEFMVATEAGEDYVVRCRETGYAANLEKAVSRPVPPDAADDPRDLAPELVHTPDQKSIADVAAFLSVAPDAIIKSLVLVADSKPVLALLRGDHQLSETKLAALLGAAELRPAHPAEIEAWCGAQAGSLGPVESNLPILADLALEGRRNLVAGANRDHYHLLHVTPLEDFPCLFADLRQAAPGDTELSTGAPLDFVKTVEIGHIFKLGYKYSEPMGLRVTDPHGAEIPVIMGSYGIGIERILCAAAELYSDDNGLALPPAIAPFGVVLTPVKATDPAQAEAARRLYDELLALGVDVLLDDRDLSPGVKFKDADLTGIPLRVNLGKKLSAGLVELVHRRPRQTVELPLDGLAARIKEILQ